MLKITKWRPDTCGCVVEYEWDDSVPSEQRTHELKKITKCPHHSALSDTGSYTKIKRENTDKNKIEGYILENFPDVADTILDQDLNVTKKLKPGIKYEWSFDENRDLLFSLKGVDQATNSNILNAIKKDLKEVKIKDK